MKEPQPCIVCGRCTTTRHHLIFGNGQRDICDIDAERGSHGTVPLCEQCHTMGQYRLHDNPVAEQLSKMLGQAQWERWYMCDYGTNHQLDEEAREGFRKRYGCSYL